MSRHLSQFLIKLKAVVTCRLRAQNDSKLLTWKYKEIWVRPDLGGEDIPHAAPFGNAIEWTCSSSLSGGGSALRTSTRDPCYMRLEILWRQFELSYPVMWASSQSVSFDGKTQSHTKCVRQCIQEDCKCLIIVHAFFYDMTAVVDLGFLGAEASRSHSVTPHSVRLLWTSDQSDANTSSWQHTTLTTDRHPCPGGIQTRSCRPTP
jgi:hypothetical protein